MVLASENSNMDTSLIGAKLLKMLCVYIYIYTSLFGGGGDKPYDLVVFFPSNITWAAITDMTTQFHQF